MTEDELRRRLDAAGSARKLAKELGTTHTTVTKALAQYGIETRVKRVGHPKPPPTAEECAEWQRLYDEAGSVSELARRLGKTPGTAEHHLRRHGIEPRSSGFKSPKSVSHSGPDNARWAGGTYRHSAGYVYVYAPEHPAAASAKGYVLEHRLVMERHLGRLLGPNEVVHHVNEVKDDNRIENLELHSRSTHMALHKAAAERARDGRFLE